MRKINMILTRSDLQTKISQLIEDNPGDSKDQIRFLVKEFLDTLDLTKDSLSHEFIRDHIMEDLNSYIGLEDNL